MDPMYRYMMPPHSYQNQRPNYYPTPEAVMYMNPPLNNNQYWPWGSGCCSHSQDAWRPPFSHIPPPYYPQSYPPFPSQYVPPPHPPFAFAYPRDQHCCACPNHLCNRKEQKSVQIEEEQPERDEINKIAPDMFKNSPYPIVWFPTDHGDSKEHQRDSKHVSADAKHNTEWCTDDKQQPLEWFGWYPFESNRSGSPKDKEERLGGQESNDGKGRFPFPAYRMPYMPEERGKEEPTKKHVVDPKLRLEPVKDSGEKSGGQPRSVVKYIPVKELKPHEEIPTPTSKDKRDSSIKDVKDVTGTKEKLTKNDPKTKSSSPPKSSKLPPVCLRVDPLPRRKDTSGSSRSSSPPEDKKKLDQVSTERKAPSPHAPKEKPDQVSNKESKEGKGVTKAIKVIDANTSQEERTKNQIEEKHEKGIIPAECTKSNDAVMKVQSEDTGSARAGNGDASIVKEEAKTSNKLNLSEADAAVIIQSAYRGFDIRRWEPVKKLKEIARVREQIAEVRELIQAMESSSDIQGDRKQRNIIAETIMSLLLKLDTIQVLHPSIKEVRKSVVRELVCLQEKLDALINEKSKALQEEEPVAARRDENVLKGSADVTPSHDSNKTGSDLVEPCQNQFDGVLNQDSEISEKILVTSKLDDEASEVSESCMPENSGSAVEPTKLKEGEQSSQSGGNSPTKEAGADSVLGHGIECSVDEVIDSFSDKEKTGSEQPLEVGGNLLMLSDAERGESDQAKQPDEGMEEAHISESNHDTNKGERDCTPELGVSLGEINTKSDATEITDSADGLSEEGCTSCEEFGTTKQVDSGCDPDECSAEPDECSAQSPKSVFSDICKSAEVANAKDNSIAEVAPNVEDANINTSQAGFSVVEEAPDMLPMEAHEAEQEPSKESTDIDEKVAEEISSDIKGSDQSSVEQRQEAEYEQQVFNEEKQTAQNQEHFPLKIRKEECVEGEGANEEEHTPEIKSVAAANVNQGETISRDDEKLIEENEKLRDMVEKLVKSGQEQLRVISSLSGRVEHLERNLSKKRKLKVKPHKGKKNLLL